MEEFHVILFENRNARGANRWLGEEDPENPWHNGEGITSSMLFRHSFYTGNRFSQSRLPPFFSFFFIFLSILRSLKQIEWGAVRYSFVCRLWVDKKGWPNWPQNGLRLHTVKPQTKAIPFQMGPQSLCIPFALTACKNTRISFEFASNPSTVIIRCFGLYANVNSWFHFLEVSSARPQLGFKPVTP